LTTQPLPVLTEAQVKLVGPVQPAGKALKPEVIDKFVAVLPSLVVNVTLTAWLCPTGTLMTPVGEGVATIVLFVVVGVVGVVGAGDPPPPPPPPHAAKIARLATTVQRLSNFTVSIII
jgi:hypothetical protein